MLQVMVSGLQAGLGSGCIQLVLGEPIAAAYAYYLSLSQKQRTEFIVLFDIGAGTIDVSLMRFVMTQLPGHDKPTLTATTIAVVGDSTKGGSDLTRAVAQVVYDKLVAAGAALGVLTVKNPKLLADMEHLKHRLCNSQREVTYSRDDGVEVSLTPAEYEVLSKPMADM